MSVSGDLQLDIDGMTNCLIDVHNAVVKNANGVLPFDTELTICQKISNTLEAVHGEDILNELIQ